WDAAERLADPLLTSEGLRHFCPLRTAGNGFPPSSFSSCVHPRISLPKERAGRWKPLCRQGRSLAWPEGDWPCLGAFTHEGRLSKARDRAPEVGNFVKLVK